MADKLFSALERFLHVEAASGIILLIAATAAFIWANSALAESYHSFAHAPITLGMGNLVATQPLHFLTNDVLMTVFFLVVGMEIRREMHESALSSLPTAALPLAAAASGVAVPTAIYFAMNTPLISL